MSYTQADLDALKAAYAKGVTELQMSNGERVRFENGAELRRRIREIEAEVLNRPRPVARFAGFSRGDR